jgi:hypothetical protein
MIGKYLKALPESAGVPPATLLETLPPPFFSHAGGTPALPGINRWTAFQTLASAQNNCPIRFSTWALRQHPAFSFQSPGIAIK